MKPHLVLINSVWHCAMPNQLWTGFGATPALAYRDWRQFKGGA